MARSKKDPVAAAIKQGQAARALFESITSGLADANQTLDWAVEDIDAEIEDLQKRRATAREQRELNASLHSNVVALLG